jgi:hypothetical protein
MAGLDWSNTSGGSTGTGQGFSVDEAAARQQISLIRQHAETMRSHAESFRSQIAGLSF